MKKIFLLLVLATILTAIPILAAVTLNVPVTGTNYTAITFNCSQASGDVKNALNASFWYNVSGGAVGTYLNKIDNSSADDLDFTSSLSVESLADGTTYNWTCRIANSTDETESAGVSNVGIDNTAPSVTLNVKPPSESYGRPFDYQCTYSDAIDASPTVSFTVAHPSGDATSSTTLTSGSSDYLSFGDTDYDGDYVFTCTITDSASNVGTKTATRTIGEMGSNWQWKKDGAKKNNNIILIALIVLAVFLLMGKKKR